MATVPTDKKRKRGANDDDDAPTVKKAKTSGPLMRLFAVTSVGPFNTKEEYFVGLKIHGDLPDKAVMTAVFRDIIVQQLNDGQKIPTVDSYVDLGVDVFEVDGTLGGVHAVVQDGVRLTKHTGTMFVPSFDTCKAVISVDSVPRHYPTRDTAAIRKLAAEFCGREGIVTFVSYDDDDDDKFVSYRVMFDND